MVRLARFYANVVAALWLLAHLAAVAQVVREAAQLRDEVAALRSRTDAYDGAWAAIGRAVPGVTPPGRRLRSVPPGRRAG